MFEYFVDVSEMIVPDNLKSGVTKAHHYDPDINANYQHFSKHYGVAIVPARAAEPKDKAKVGNAVCIVERQNLRCLRAGSSRLFRWLYQPLLSITPCGKNSKLPERMAPTPIGSYKSQKLIYSYLMTGD